MDDIEFIVESELAYSKALGGIVSNYGTFFHVHNPLISICGDFNRAVGCKITSIEEFLLIESMVEEIHQRNNLEKPRVLVQF